MLRTANIELLVLGCGEAETEQVKQALLEELSHIGRAPLPLCENLAMPRQDAVRRVECFDTVQAKLCMLFTLGVPMRPDQMAAVRLAMALYGGSVTSRLFLNVRERDHLCYYCSSSFQSFTGSMAVNSGVEHADAARAEQAILKEKAKLMILDPIQAYLGAKMDMNRANEARDMTKHLGQVAERTGCAIVLIGHMNKNAGGKVFGSRRQSPQAGRFRGSQDRYSRCRSRAFW
mgnify:CR=1 FL=1